MNLAKPSVSFGRFQVLTAPGPGAVAVVEVSCNHRDVAELFLRRIQHNRRSRPAMELQRICYGRWNGEDLVVVRTSEVTWEIQCHGGLAAVERICRDLVSDGLQQVSPTASVVPPTEPQSQQRSIHQIVKDAIRLALPNAGSRKTAGLILAQSSNSLSSDIALLRSVVEDHTVEAVRRKLARWQDVARHLTEPWLVALVGPPNVGKSSLMNAIAGMERSIVCDQPGTTRDAVEFDAVIDGWPFRFTDTAGIRESSQDKIEQDGMRRSLLAASSCDVLCFVVDQTADSATWIRTLTPESLPKHCIVLRNKSDLAKSERSNLLTSSSTVFHGKPEIDVSAYTNRGLPELLTWIRMSVVPSEPDQTTALLLPTLPMEFLEA